MIFDHPKKARICLPSIFWYPSCRLQQPDTKLIKNLLKDSLPFHILSLKYCWRDNINITISYYSASHQLPETDSFRVNLCHTTVVNRITVTCNGECLCLFCVFFSFNVQV